MDATSGALWRKSMIWKLIDTAPKDGQMILVWMDYQRKEDGGSVFAARWYQDENDNDEEYNESGWYAYPPDIKDGTMVLMRYEPSHWMQMLRSPNEATP
jgi:hypothetical protein